MKVFISWSGNSSKIIAEGLFELIPMVLQYVNPWLSESNLNGGDRWSVEIAKELETTNFGIICLTPKNLTSQWLLFEAGALAKSINQSKVIPYLFNLDFADISGPLSQFQALKANYEGTLGILQSINDRAELPIEKYRLEILFKALWPKYLKRLDSISLSTDAERKQRNQKELLNELVLLIRGVDQRTRLLEASQNLLIQTDINNNSDKKFSDSTRVADSERPSYQIAHIIISAENEEKVLAYRRLIKHRSSASAVRVSGGKHGAYLIQCQFRTPQTDFNVFHIVAEESDIEINDLDFYT